MTTVGIIGSGHVGSNLAKAAIAHGYDVVLSGSGEPDALRVLAIDLGPKARAGKPPRPETSRSSRRPSRPSSRSPSSRCETRW